MDALSRRLHAIVVGHLSKLDTYTMKKGLAKDDIIAEFAKDPLYSVFGLDTQEYVAAILGGGTITSIHRKIGDLYEECAYTIITDCLGLPPNMPRYTASIVSGTTTESRTIDAQIPFDRINPQASAQLKKIAGRELLGLTNRPKGEILGIGFEVRHCYQSADSKRIQADEAMARHLVSANILPVMLVFCNQSNRQIMVRYKGTWVLKEGVEAYRFLAEITGFNFYGFLEANSVQYREIVRKALQRITE